jgi:heat shock protein HtpX
MMVIAVIMAGAIGFFAEIFFRMMFQSGFGWGRGRSSSSSDSDRKGSGGAMFAILIAVALIVVAWLLSVMIRFALSRSREFLADAGAVELTKNSDAMISALRKIENRGELQGATSAVMEMCVDNPRSGFADIFATHPSIDARVKALVDLAGGHDPGPIAQLPGTESETGNQVPGDPPQDGTAPSAEPAPTPQRDSPFLPSRPPIEIGVPLPPADGPWGKPRA